MKFINYNPLPSYGCVVRTFSKLLDKDQLKVKEELEDIAKELGYENINEIEVFDTYFERNNYTKEDMDIFVKDFKIKKGKYGVFCNKDDRYHMFAVINDTAYDKNIDYLEMKVISIYKYKE